jgi:hypothetical protein
MMHSLPLQQSNRNISEQKIKIVVSDYLQPKQII